MTAEFWLPALIPLTSLAVGITIFLLKEDQRRLRTVLNLASALTKVILVVVMVWGVYHQREYNFRMPLFMGFEIVLAADELSLLFASLSATLWFITTLYAIGYLDLDNIKNRRRFFGFFSLCVSATTGIALAGNLFTYLFFYEMLTVTTYPLIVHRGSTSAMQAGRVYLAYTLVGGALLLLGMVWLSSLVGPADFVEGGILTPLVRTHRHALTIIFTLLIIGFGVKSALVPLQGWLPMAMIAPAPVSALLHAVAVVKAGAFGIVRVVYNVYGAAFCTELRLMSWLAVWAAVTILYGSLQALFQDDFKRRLAYSTVSQLSYIALGVAMVHPVATTGGIVHLVHQGVMKITMFFCAGNLAEALHITQVSRMNGVGRRMPWTMGAFTVAALGMIGIPPMAGFVSKWYLGMGALQAGQGWIVVVLLTSTLLNAAYFLPIIYRAWFLEPDGSWKDEVRTSRFEIHPYLLFPPILTAAFTVLAGVFARVPFSPLQWAKLIIAREFGL